MARGRTGRLTIAAVVLTFTICVFGIGFSPLATRVVGLGSAHAATKAAARPGSPAVNVCDPNGTATGTEVHIHLGLTVFVCNTFSANGHGFNTVYEFAVQAKYSVQTQEMLAEWWEARENNLVVSIAYDTGAVTTGCGGAVCRLISSFSIYHN
jgi:hypothetical protein